MSPFIIYWLVIALMLAGIIGSLIPSLPGAATIVLGIVIWGATQGWAEVSLALAVAVAVLLLSELIDFLAVYWGAQKVGASKWGQIGAVIGLFLGIFGLLPALPFGGPLLGMLVGPLVGAFLGEFLYRQDLETNQRWEHSLKAGAAVVVSSLLGNVLEGALALAAAIVFIVETWPPPI